MKLSRPERDPASDGLYTGSLGAWLKSAREERGESLDEISKITRIGKNYLEAMEEDALAKLPSQAYTRAFIRLYASHLNLSPEKALSMLEGNQANPEEVNNYPHHQPEHTDSPLLPYRRILILIAVLAVALSSGYLLIKPKPGSRITTENRRIDSSYSGQPATAPDTQKQQNAPATEPSPPQTSQQKNAENQWILLRLKAVSDGKIHITIDGSVSQEYDLIAGDLVEWKAESAFILDLENAASVEGELDGVRLKPFGEQGKAVHIVLKADGIHKE